MKKDIYKIEFSDNGKISEILSYTVGPNSLIVTFLDYTFLGLAINKGGIMVGPSMHGDKCTKQCYGYRNNSYIIIEYFSPYLYSKEDIFNYSNDKSAAL